MSCKKRKIRYYPTFRVSDCPLPCPPGPQGDPGATGPAGPGITPVYGSLYTTGNVLATGNTNVNFDMIGLSSGVTLDINDGPTGNSITVISPGIYNISFSTTVRIVGEFEDGIHGEMEFRLSISGTPSLLQVIEFKTFNSGNDIVFEAYTLSRTDQLALDQGDVIQILIDPIITGDISYTNSALVVTKVA
ncbi:hypothetical protein [Psychrobacillus sp. OK032]|uniref:hypothetical protein n=1 Tax=Psychrobacillus sp. OK032 TaxID=1884358 RepID=UPI0008B8F94A|nr:hypothetical protein [Psychrobacillus sp. OK032]SES45934.1 hypothetical protein SAMN05518872_1224 [Psychrobacillus sp. OK032]